MVKSPFHQAFEDLPTSLPVFPLSGVLLLPGGRMPINIFEPRYLTMAMDAIAGNRLIGMVQPSRPEEIHHPSLYGIGCAGRITAFAETDDGRLLITLTGICRFRLKEELETRQGYRRFAVDFSNFRADMEGGAEVAFDRDRLFAVLGPYLRREDMEVNLEALRGFSSGTLVTTLSMMCPFAPREKQALLETIDAGDRADMLITLLEMEMMGGTGGSVCQ